VRILPVRAGRRDRAIFENEKPPRLVLRFAVVLSLSLAVTSAVILVVVHHFALTQSERAATKHAGVVASVLLQREVTAADFDGKVRAERRAELDRLFSTYVLAEDVTAVSLVRKDGLVTYSTDHVRIGTTEAGRLAAEAATGTIVSRVFDGRPGAAGRDGKRLETFAPVSPGANPGAAVIEQAYEPIEQAARSAQLRVGVVLEALLLVLLLVFVPLLVRVTRKIKAQIQRIHRQAYYDGLTDLPNRAHLFERLEVAVRRARENKGRLALLIVDLDRFREINETLGHDAGDLLLAETARRLQAGVGSERIVARIGGDEFAVATEHGSEDEIEALVTAIRMAVEPPLMVGDVQIAVDATVGIAYFPGDGESAEALLKHAEIALHTAKEWKVPSLSYSPAVDPHDPEQLGLVAALKTAAKEGEIRLHYQPKVSLRTGEVVGYEALAHWQHPTRGLLPPGAFVPAAERTGVIRHISRVVLADAVAQLASFRELGSDRTISVNLTAIDLLDLKLPRRLEALFRRHGVDPGRLCIELTESTVMADPERAQSTLERIAATGVRISIDDFGTGHSSLAYLKSLPANELKIDRGFVSDMTISRQDRLIVLATIKLAQSLGLRVVAEGVETEDIHNALLAIGCDYAQGYLYGRPQPAEDVSRSLTTSTQAAA
jgi:diguanylate cyclase (GGDEF)-like protein